MITITIKNANQCQLDGDIQVLRKLRTDMSIKHPNAFHILQYQRGSNKWDGIVRFVDAYGKFPVGLLSIAVKKLQDYGEKVKLVDNRLELDIVPVVPNTLGKFTLRAEQKNSLEAIINNRVLGIPFYVCCANLSVNFGKTLLFAAMFECFHRKVPTIVLLNDSDLFKQFKDEMKNYLPGVNITFIQGGKVKEWSMFNVAMVQSLAQNLDTYSYQLSNVGMVLIDEADGIDNKTYSSVLKHLWSTVIRVGLSGTLFKGRLKKDQLKIMNIKSFIGEVVDEVKLTQQIATGRSTPVVIKSITLDYPTDKTKHHSYQEEYQNNIIDNEDAYKEVLKRVKYNLKYGRKPMMVVVKYILHSEKMGAYLQKALPKLKVVAINHTSKERQRIIDDFKLGSIDILVVTTIITRGKNMPLLKYACNAASMDGEEKTIQLLGRLVRTHISKSVAYMDDLIFPGKYLSKHGRHRKNYYLREDLKVINIPHKKGKKRNKKKLQKPIK